MTLERFERERAADRRRLEAALAQAG
ncbi:MAG: hypothetical protein JWR30_2550, partial [Conexibacter sp.]|nr:hypothetical protein [Conexibacter sp.]